METININDGWITFDKTATINFEKDYVHAPDTSLFKGIPCGKLSEENANMASARAGFKFYKIIDMSESIKEKLKSNARIG